MPRSTSIAAPLALLLTAIGSAFACPAAQVIGGAEIQRWPEFSDPDLARRVEQARAKFSTAAAAPDSCEPLVAHGLAGNASTVELFMALEKFDGGFGVIWRDVLDWIDADAVPDTGGHGIYWEAIHCDGKPGPGRITAAWNAELFARAYVRTGDAAYLSTMEEALQWLDREKYPAGTWPHYPLESDGYIWFEWTYPPPSPHFFSLGAEAGIVAIGRYCLEIYRLVGDPLARDLAEGVGRLLRDTKVDDPISGHYWNTSGGGPYDPTKTSAFCAGQSGYVEFLIDMATTFPASTDPDYGSLAQGALTVLETYGVPENGGMKWGQSLNPLLPGGDTFPPATGLGTAGVARAFLAGYEEFGDRHYLDVARLAGDWLISQAVSNGNRKAYWLEPGSTVPNTTWCRGNVGILHLMARLYEQTLDFRYAQAGLRALRFLHGSQIPTALGSGAVIPETIGGDTHKSDWIWGLSGLVHPFYDDAELLLQVPKFKKLSLNAAYFLEDTRVESEVGSFWPYILDIPAPSASSSVAGNPLRPSAKLEFCPNIDPKGRSTIAGSRLTLPRGPGTPADQI